MFPLKKIYNNDQKSKEPESEVTTSAFTINRGYGQYDNRENNDPVLSLLKKMSSSQQIQIRTELNRHRPSDKKITHGHIDPGSNSFDQEAATLVAKHYYKNKVSPQINKYDNRFLQRKFTSIDPEIRKELINNLGIWSKSDKIRRYTREEKKEVIKEFMFENLDQYLKNI